MLQKQINTEAAMGVQGDLAVTDQAVYFPLNLLADANGIKIGSFVWRAADGRATNTQGTVAPLGIAQRNISYPEEGDKDVIVENLPVMTVVRGDMYVLSTTAANAGDNVFAMANGAVACNAAETLSGGVATGWKVAKGATEVNQLVLVTK